MEAEKRSAQCSSRCVPLVWGEDDPIPLYVETGSRVLPEPDGSLRLSRAYHESEGKSLKRIQGTRNNREQTTINLVST